MCAEKPIEVTKPVRKEEARKLAGKFQGEPTYQGLIQSLMSLTAAISLQCCLKQCEHYHNCLSSVRFYQ